MISKKVLLSKTLGELPKQFDKQCGCTRADFLNRLRESGFAFSGRLRERIDQAFAEIDRVTQRAVRKHDENEQPVTRRCEDLNKTLQHLAKLKQQFSVGHCLDNTIHDNRTE